MRNWLNNEEKIYFLKRSKKTCWYGKAKFPVMEKELYTKFFDMQKEGKLVKRWWFNSKARELMKEKYPDEASSFKLSHRWFEGFCRRYRISLRRKTHTALRTQLRKSIQGLYESAKKKLSHIRTWVTWTKRRCLLIWMTTYEKTGADQVCIETIGC